MIKRLTYPLILLMAILLMAITSCTRDRRSLLHTIPADVRFVAMFEPEAILASQHIAIGHEGLPENDASALTLQKAIGPDWQILTAIYTTVATDAWAAWQRGLETGLTGFVIDSDRLHSLLESDFGKPLKQEGYDVWVTPSDSRFYTDGKQWWLIMGPADAATPAEVLADAKKAAAADIPGVGSWLNEAGMGRIALRITDIADCWATLRINLTEKRLTINASAIDSEGRDIAFSSFLAAPDYRFLNLVPRDCDLVAAVAAGKEIDWDAVAGLAGMAGGFQALGTVEALMPILKKIDGTVGVAVSLQGLGEPIMPFGLYARMKHDDAARAIETLRAYASRLMLQPRYEHGTLAVDYGDITLRAFHSDGFLVVTSFDTASTLGFEAPQRGSLGFATLHLDGNVLGAVSATRPLPFSVDAAISIENDEATLSIELPGASAPLLVALINALK